MCGLGCHKLVDRPMIGGMASVIEVIQIRGTGMDVNIRVGSAPPSLIVIMEGNS